MAYNDGDLQWQLEAKAHPIPAMLLLETSNHSVLMASPAIFVAD